jgi:hypothetical protein
LSYWNIPKPKAGVVVVAAGWLLPNVNGDVEVIGAVAGTELPNEVAWKQKKFKFSWIFSRID